MQKSFGRFHGLLSVPTESRTNWDSLASEFRQQTVVGPISLTELLAGRSGLLTNSEGNRIAADCHRLSVELHQAFTKLCN